MTAALFEEFRPTVKADHPITSIELMPGGAGVFDVTVDGKLIYSKQETGRHATHEEVIQSVRDLLG